MTFTTIAYATPQLHVTVPLGGDSIARSLEDRLVDLLADAMARGYVIEVGQRIDPLKPRDAVTVASLRRARGYY